MELQVAHTAHLGGDDLRAVRALLDAAFAGDVSDDDYEHALGGMHVLAHDAGALVGHGSVVMRRLLHRGRALRTGHVEAVAVLPHRQRQGVGSAVMAQLEQLIRDAYELGALGSSEAALGFYAGRGWVRWPGTASALTPWGVQRTPDDEGGIFLLPVGVELDLRAEITCDWRNGDVW